MFVSDSSKVEQTVLTGIKELQFAGFDKIS